MVQTLRLPFDPNATSAFRLSVTESSIIETQGDTA